jgi:Domain of unknown function (DUF4145)
MVKARILAEHVTTTPYKELGELPDTRVSLALCSSCNDPITVRQTWQGEDDLGASIWSVASRVWPLPEREAHTSIPPIVRVSLEEAERCFIAGAHTASVVMSGRALEGVGRHFDTSSWKLAESLKELRDRGVIDPRLFEWGDALRRDRNLAAHASEEKFSKEDATDLLDFIHAICEHVFVLVPKFRAFMERRSKT